MIARLSGECVTNAQDSVRWLNGGPAGWDYSPESPQELSRDLFILSAPPSQTQPGDVKKGELPREIVSD